MVRHITLWTLGRYSEWIVAGGPGAAVLESTLRALLDRMRDPVKKVWFLWECLVEPSANLSVVQVQQSACQAMSTFVDAARGSLAQYLPVVVEVRNWSRVREN